MSEYLKELNSRQLPEIIEEMRKEAQRENIPTVRNATLNMLLTLVSLKKPARILEIGTAYGCSGVAMLTFAKNAFLTTIEKDEKAMETAKENFKKAGVYDRAEFFSGDASEIIPMLGGKYDFVFLDGPKGHYAEYLPYLTDLTSSGGILFADDVMFWGYVDSDEIKKKHATIYRSLREYLDKISKDERLLTTVIGDEDGFSVSLKVKE